jgi:hypothetical protein
MRLPRLLGTRRLLSVLLLLRFGFYGIESEVADVHDVSLETAGEKSANGIDSGMHVPQAPPGTTPSSDNHPAHVCHCSHTHLGVIAAAPTLKPVVIPAPPREWRAPALLPSLGVMPPLRPPIA